MAEATWEKSPTVTTASARAGRWKFLVGGMLILVAVGYLIISGTVSGARYFITVDELVNNPEYIGKTVRISGAVIGDSIQYDSRSLIIDFTIANLPQDYQDLAVALHQSATDPTAARLAVRVENQVKPDLLTHEAQAILSGRLDASGTFHATELLLKCPTRFEEADHGKTIVQPEA
jgi:cytochrome c-type biogenesis protein CcmE